MNRTGVFDNSKELCFVPANPTPLIQPGGGVQETTTLLNEWNEELFPHRKLKRGGCNPFVTSFQTAWSNIVSTCAANARKPYTETMTQSSSYFPSSYPWNFWGGILAPNGCIYNIPYNGHYTVYKVNVNTGAVTSIGRCSIGYTGAACLENGMIYAFPFSGGSSILEIDSNTDTLNQLTGFGSIPSIASAIRGFDGMLYCIPRAGALLRFNPGCKTIETLASGFTAQFSYGSGVLTPGGFIYCMPIGESRILKINTNNGTCLTIDLPSGVSGQWFSGALAPNGCIYSAPFNGERVLKIDTSSDMVSLVGSSFSGSDKYMGSVLAPNGIIYGIPKNTSYILRIDPATDTVTQIASGYTFSESYNGGILTPKGNIFVMPCKPGYVRIISFGNDDIINFNANTLLSPFLNKY